MDSVVSDMIRVTSTTSGTGNLFIGSTVNGYFGFSGLISLDTVYYTIFDVDGGGNPNGNVEVGIGQFTSAGGQQLIRSHVIKSSNSNALVNFGSGTKHIIVSTAAAAIMPEYVNEFRLTLESGVPVSLTDKTAKSTLYWTPFTGNCCAAYVAGVGLRRFRSSGTSVALSGLTSGKNYDVVIYFTSSGVLRLDLMPAWTNDTTRANAVTTVQGNILVNTASFTSVINGDSVAASSATVIGTIRTTSTTTTEDSKAHRFVWNRYNRVERPLFVTDATSSWTYGSAAWRPWNNSTANRVDWVRGEAIEVMKFDFCAGGYSAAGNTGYIGIGLDSTSSQSAQCSLGGGGVAYFNSVCAHYVDHPSGIGYHYAQALEFGFSTPIQFNGGSGSQGLFGSLWM